VCSSDFDKDDGIMKSLNRIAMLMVVVALSMGAVTRIAAFADPLPQPPNAAISIADVLQQDGTAEATPEATPEATEAASVRDTISEAVSNRSTAEAESSSAISTLFSIIVTAIVAAVVLAAAVAGALYVGFRLVGRKGD
jgi:hypothetical protein